MGPLNMHVLILAAPIDNWVFGGSGPRQDWRELTEVTGLCVASGQTQGSAHYYGRASAKTLYTVFELSKAAPTPPHPFHNICLAPRSNRRRQDGQSDATCATSAHADRNK